MSKIRETLSRWEGKYYKQKIQKTAKCCGENLYCGGKSFVTSNTELGMNENFNGMSIFGNGKIMIGDNFHSGPGCQIISCGRLQRGRGCHDHVQHGIVQSNEARGH